MAGTHPQVIMSVRRFYWLWGILLFTFLAIGGFSWLAVVPLWQVHSAVGDSELRVDDTKDGQQHRREECVRMLGGARRAARRLESYIRLPRWIAGRRMPAIALLTECGSPGVEVLGRLLEHSDCIVRKSAANALRMLAPEINEAIPMLTVALSDSDPDVREYVSHALALAGARSRDAVPALVLALQDSEGEVVVNAAWALGEVGASAQVALPELTQLAADQRADVRDAVAKALKKIKKAVSVRPSTPRTP